MGVYPFTGLDHWTGILDWTNGLSYFPFLDKFVCYIFVERSLRFYNQQVPSYYAWMIIIITKVVYCSVFSILENVYIHLKIDNH